jgi:hypothetical protein
MNVFAKLSEMISEIGYEPISQSQTSKSTYTLHTAIRDLCNMAKHEAKQLKSGSPTKSTKPQEVHIIADDADVSFWNFLVLREYLRKITELIDAEVALVVGKPTHFAAWDHDSRHSKTDVLKLLNSLSKKHPVLPDPPQATSRPQAREMVAKGKIEAAIANTLAVMTGNGMQYGDLFEKIAGKPISNEDLLVDLDNYVEQHKCDRLTYDNKTLVPRNLVQAYLKFKDNADSGTDRDPSLAKFLASMSTTNNFSGNSDEMLIKRLNAS